MKTGRVVPSPPTSDGGRPTSHSEEEHSQTPQRQKKKAFLLRESKLELNQGLLERLRNPSQQVEFYEAIQQSMMSADKTPPKLLNSSDNINPGIDLSNTFLAPFLSQLICSFPIINILH